MPTASLLTLITLLPIALMVTTMLPARGQEEGAVWRRFRLMAPAALGATALTLALHILGVAASLPSGLGASLTGAWIAVLVQLLGTVICSFSARYLQGELGQARYVTAFSGVLAAVHLLLLADHWLVLIAAWAAAGMALERLLCFYPDRPFALLAAHKKRLADRLADLLLVAAAALAWNEVGSGAFSDLWLHLDAAAPMVALQASAICLTVAVMLRTALLPVHGWLMQVMEAPTPVSALLHAGVVNLGGFVLIRFAPLLEVTPVARWLLVGMGLTTATLAGLVMLTRVSIKVRLAWSTAAQMGFMVMECGLGLYTLALMHLIGHSLYKAHAFLAASGAVEATRLRMMRLPWAPSLASLVVAPLAAAAVVGLLVIFAPFSAWPMWWSGVLALAWAPLLWWPVTSSPEAPGTARHVLTGAGMVAALALAAFLGHALPFGVRDDPHHAAGLSVLIVMALFYGFLAMLQVRPRALATLRRWSYAGFYVDELVTRSALRLWPARITPTATPPSPR